MKRLSSIVVVIVIFIAAVPYALVLRRNVRGVDTVAVLLSFVPLSACESLAYTSGAPEGKLIIGA